MKLKTFLWKFEEKNEMEDIFCENLMKKRNCNGLFESNYALLCELKSKFTKNVSQVHSHSFQFTKNMSQEWATFMSELKKR